MNLTLSKGYPVGRKVDNYLKVAYWSTEFIKCLMFLIIEIVILIFKKKYMITYLMLR